ncbi:MAG: hypothetical protein K2Y32_22710 [Candidatus Obscuribacterales bacterium]|nr:hypothetical protein [Candidatus Obscuribacterales bacterium]
MSRQLIVGGLSVAILGSVMLSQTLGLQAGARLGGATNNSTFAGAIDLSKLPRAEAGSKEQITMHKDLATTAILGGKERFLTFVSTDKPIYKSGEKVYARGVLLDAAEHKPLAGNNYENVQIAILGPKGENVAAGSAQVQDSVWGFAWEVPEGQAGGQYTLKATYPWNGHCPAERKFDVRAYRAPRLKSQITFLRDGYGPGEKVNATLEVKRAEGGVPAGAKVTVSANIDGVEVSGGTAKVDEHGLCQVSLQLPGHIARGEGTLALVVEDGGVVETASKTIPIILQTVDLNIYPEGGDLVSGFSNRVYIQAKQPNGKPADLSCKLICKENGAQVATFKTEHEGRGRFEFEPEAGKSYFISIDEPAGIKTTYALPAAKAKGAVLRASSDICAKGAPLTVLVAASEPQYKVTLSRREEIVGECQVDLKKRSDAADKFLPVTFNLPENIDGVLTATVWSQSDQPLAERLIFREPKKAIKVSVKADKEKYVPGEGASLTVKATDSDGKPISAVVGLTVTDDSVLEMVEKREQAPRLPVMVFLEPEVKDLADAHVYLGKDNPKAAMATDLLLGTQGWRRFALVNLADFIEKNGDDARRAVALKIRSEAERDHVMRLEEGQAFGGMGGMALGMVRQRGAAGPWAMPGARPMAAPAPMPAGMAMPKMAARRDQPLVADMRIVAKSVGNDKAAPEKIAAAPKDSEAKLQSAINNFIAAKEKRAILADELAPMSLSNLVMVREFAHQVRADRQANDRVDFAETLYWNAGVRTDAATGEAKVKFDLSDSVTTFKVFADAFSGSGAVGAAAVGIESVQPFYAEMKMPLEVTAGDKILLPVSLVNATTGSLSGVNVSTDLKGDFKLGAPLGLFSTMAGDSRLRLLQPIDVGIMSGGKPLVLSAKAGQFSDRIERQILVKPKGFPVEESFAGILEPGKAVVHNIKVPGTVVPASMISKTAVYATPLANMTEALERMIQDPYGCFEQTCSTSYPLTMAQQYFMSHTGVNPKLVETSKQKLDSGYKRLVSYWCPDRGYEWFGENPGHEALTAFGLMHFNDMAKVREVDRKMIDTTRTWLFKQRDGNGGFSRKRRALHTWIEDKDCSNAYILWALLESGQPASELAPELASIKAAAAKSENSYVTALAANALCLAGDKSEASKLMDKLAAKQKSDGSVSGVKSSIVGSEGQSLEVEGVSLAALAWMRDPKYAGNVEKSIKYLADSCKAGRYGTTQSTVLALRAIVKYDEMHAKPKAAGRVRLYVDGQSIGDWADFSPSTEGAIKLPDMTELLSPGEHKLELRMEGGAPMPYSMAVQYNAIKPASSDACKLEVETKLAQTKLSEGLATEATMVVVNKTKDVVPSPVAILGLPGGLEPRHDQLKELVKKGTIDAYEVKGREVVLYWRTLAGGARVEVPVSVIAAVPGTYTGPASRGYLYYNDEHKHWADGLQVEIVAANK